MDGVNCTEGETEAQEETRTFEKADLEERF
jgi:hypothetical protein